MPITKSAKKALRQTKRRNELNLKRKTALKKAIKDFKKLAQAKKKNEANEALKNLYKLADKTVKTKFIKKNKAARIKSRAAKFLQKSIA